MFYIRSFMAVEHILSHDGYSGLLNEPDTVDYNNINTTVELDNNINNKLCNNQIIKLTDESVNCLNVCKDGEYIKRTINYAGFEPGPYCVPLNLSSCHPFAGIIVKDMVNKWTCMSVYPTVFGGRNADEIVACDGNLFDSAARKTYHGQIPSDLMIYSNPEHETNADGSFRFSCPIKNDHMNNPYISTDISRLHTIPNKCARALFNDSGKSYPDFINGTCTCTNSFVSYNNDRDPPYCAPMLKKTDTVQQFYEPCMNINAPFDMNTKPCGSVTITGKNLSALYKYDLYISKIGVSDYIVQDLQRTL